MKTIKAAILSQDLYTKKIEMNYKSKTEISSLSGGICSIIEKMSFLIIFLISIISITKYEDFEINQGFEFYNLDDLNINITDTMDDFVFAINHNRKPVDMVDNEYA